MSLITVPIIAEPPATVPLSRDAVRRRDALILSALTAAWGLGAALFYYAQGLTLSHYDARAHLVVARRILDSLTPGWKQIGAVWLPLPHLLNMLPVQVDAFYRTGASGVALSIASMSLAAYAVASLVVHATGSRFAAASAVLLMALNPNLLYLQSTPMTEPLLFGLIAYSAWALYRWSWEPLAWQRAAGWALVGACLTRYEAWPFIGAALALAALARWQIAGFTAAALQSARVAAYPLLAVVAFLFHSRATVGEWFVTGGFYIPDPVLQGNTVAVTQTIWHSAGRLGGPALLWAALVGALIVAAAALRRRHLSLLVPLALLAVAALPWYAFFQGHPHRIRYMVPLVFAAITSVGMALGLLERRVRLAAGLLVVAAVLATTRPFDARAPMVQEAQWDVARTTARRPVTTCLVDRREPRDSVLISMSALAHYMQDMSQAGLGIRDFIHEGNGRLWTEALARPADHVNWMLIDVRSRHRDQLKARAEADPEFLRGFSPVCEAAGVSLFKRDAYGKR